MGRIWARPYKLVYLYLSPNYKHTCEEPSFVALVGLSTYILGDSGIVFWGFIFYFGDLSSTVIKSADQYRRKFKFLHHLKMHLGALNTSTFWYRANSSAGIGAVPKYFIRSGGVSLATFLTLFTDAGQVWNSNWEKVVHSTQTNSKIINKIIISSIRINNKGIWLPRL